MLCTYKVHLNGTITMNVMCLFLILGICLREEMTRKIL